MYKPYECILTHSSCYKRTKPMNIKGILWHSTGANNPNLKRYVQPYEGDPNYAEAIAKLGYNRNHNDWNHQKNSVGVNAFIGKFVDGTVGTVQTLPWNYRPWGCAGGKNGSCNNGWIQFEICEDGLKDKAYAQKVWDEAINLSVYLCKLYGLDPSKMAVCGKVQVPVITCHNDASKAGCASGHADINHWFPNILGKNMDNARSEIYSILINGAPAPIPTQMPTKKVEVAQPTVRYGSTGANAKLLQHNLNQCGATLEEDGIFGKLSTAALIRWQYANKLTADGIYGKKSEAKMKELLS